MKKLLLFLSIILLCANFAYAKNTCPLCGEATEAKQDAGNADLSIIAGDTTSIDGKIPSDPSTVTEQDQTQALIGEVQASPTANTVLDRLKDVNTAQSDGTQKSQIINGSGNIANVDSMTNSLQIIEFEHHEIHEGNSFERHIDSANLAVATINVAFFTASGTKKAHMLFGW